MGTGGGGAGAATTVLRASARGQAHCFPGRQKRLLEWEGLAPHINGRTFRREITG